MDKTLETMMHIGAVKLLEKKGYRVGRFDHDPSGNEWLMAEDKERGRIVLADVRYIPPNENDCNRFQRRPVRTREEFEAALVYFAVAHKDFMEESEPCMAWDMDDIQCAFMGRECHTMLIKHIVSALNDKEEAKCA